MFEVGSMVLQLQGELDHARVYGSEVSASEWVGVVGSCQELINVVTAVQTVALAHVAATEEAVCEDGTIDEEFRGLGHQRLDAPAMVHDLLGLTASGATNRMATAVDLVTRHPRIIDAVATGRLDGYRAGIVSEELTDAEPDVCEAVVSRIEPWLGSEAGGALRRRTRRVLAAVDADLVRHRADRARAERSLRRSAFAPGVDEWSAKVPVEQSRAAWSVVDELARRYVADGACTGIEQARADALMDLIHARATGEITVHLTVPASHVAREAAAADAAGDGARDAGDLVPVKGFGMPGVTHVRASWVSSVTGERGPRGDASGQGSQGSQAGPRDPSSPSVLTPSASVDVVACHDATGALMSLPMGVQGRPRRSRGIAAPAANAVSGAGGPGRYRPPRWMVDFVKARDGLCRFPGCSVSARFCDVDHVVPWPVGATDPANLVCLCRRHHRVKQRPRWRSRLDADGTLVWTDPTGCQRSTLPLDHLQLDQLQLRESGRRVAAEPHTPVPRPAIDAPSALDDEFEHLLDARLVDLSCQPDTLTAHNRLALRAGRRVSTSVIQAALSQTRQHPVELGYAKCDLHVSGLGSHPSRPGARATPSPGSDEPPPF